MTGNGRCLSTVLVAAAGELTDLASVADQLGGVGLGDIERWQALDRLSQHLAGMAAFLTGLSVVVPPIEPALDHALAVLTTSALADRLVGRTGGAGAESGDMELFGA